MNKKIKNATPTEYNGIIYRSVLEANCAEVFDKAGIEVQYEPYEIVLLPAFNYFGEALRKITYTPDFVGDSFIVECKGYPNDNWHDKRKWIMNYLLKNSSKLRFYEIHSVKELEKLIKIFKNKLIEEWRPVKNFEDLYEVSNLGYVRSIQYHGKKRIKEMTQSLDRLGYRTVKLRNWKETIVGNFYVHRLVAQAFIPNPDNKPYVDHIDANTSNNVVTNLKWATSLENQNNPITLARLKNAITSYNKSGDHKKDVQKSQGYTVLQYDRKGNFIAEYSSISAAADALECSTESIRKVCIGKHAFYRNFVFKYKEK